MRPSTNFQALLEENQECTDRQALLKHNTVKNAAPIAWSLVHARPPKTKPDLEPERLSNNDIVKNDSSAAGDKHTTIESGSTLAFDVMTHTQTNGRAEATFIRRYNNNHSQTTMYNGREYLDVETVRSNTPCPNDCAQL